jgi:hypothetical protein
MTILPTRFDEIRLGMTRDEVVTILGEPSLKDGTSRKYKTPRVFKYYDDIYNIEFYFEPWKLGKLLYVRAANEKGQLLKVWW